MKFRNKVMQAPLAIMIVLATLFMFALDHYLESILERRIEMELQGLASFALASLPDVNDSYKPYIFHTLANRLGKAGNARITFFDNHGNVLGDSELSNLDLELMENHINKEEVREAINTGSGSSRYYDSSLEQDMFYFAVSNPVPIMQAAESKAQKPAFFVARTALPESSISESIISIRVGLLLISAFGLSCIGFLNVLSSRLIANAATKDKSMLEQKVTHRTHEISLLYSLSSFLSACRTMEEAGEVINTIIPKLLPDLTGALFLIKASRNRLDLLVSWGEDWQGRKKFAPDECWALRRGHIHFSKEHDIQIFCSHTDDPYAKQTICIPLVAQGDTLGTMELIYEDDQLSEENHRLVVSIAEQLGLGLANLRLRDDLRQQAIRDPLTGLYNRRYLMESLEQALNRSKRQNTSLALVMIDLDNFKRFNDTFGHDAGDFVLERIANEIKQHSRSSDIPCRYGGEEFCIVYTDTGAKDAIYLAEKLRETVRLLSLNYQQKSLGQVTLSIGVAIYPDHAVDIEHLLKTADEALYQAKAEGRNKLVMSELPSDPVSSDKKGGPVLAVSKS